MSSTVDVSLMVSIDPGACGKVEPEGYSRFRPVFYGRGCRPRVRPAQLSIASIQMRQEESSGTQCGMRMRSNVLRTAIAGVGGIALGSAAFFKLRS